MDMLAQSWHDLDNVEYDCWPMKNPDEHNMIDCAGLEMSWVDRPPEKVRSGEEFNVTYAVSVSDSFYQMAVTNGILKYSYIDNASEAKRFCEEKECPSNWKHATEDNCCIYHANVHSCPMAFMKKGGICGPWIPDDGEIVTHTVSQAGKMSQQNWTTKVVLVHVGVTSLIAHIKVGQMHAALEAKTTVQSAQVCDDGVCDEDERCDTCPADCGSCPMSIGIKASIGLPITFFCTGFILTLVWMQYQKQKLLWDESWIISLKEMSPGSRFLVGIGSVATVRQTNGISNLSEVTDASASGYAASPVHKPGFIQTGIYDGRTVAIKRIRKKTFTLSKTIRKEVKQVRELDHPNLCKFIGGSVEVPNVTIVTEYCPKGSLSDVLFNDDIPLNWGFRLSFATDVARGVAYLHQHKVYHGRLQSTNCVIDDRWVCKIADYGLAVYRRDDFEELTIGFVPRMGRIYCAPEVIAGTSSNMSPTADVYSYSIILLQIATRCDPVPGDVDLGKVELTWRPNLPKIHAGKSDSDCPTQQDYDELIKKCWAHNPLLRPTFEQVKKMLEKMNPNKVSPVDMMMNLMEKYSKHLEVIVAERTQDLLQEKQKTDSLLYSMLPRAVADDLRQGIASEAQSYSNATVYFSDIVGFTQLSSASTPYQVVDFLNRLYTTFDDIIDNYDVYKVETIGDAYMVVSGVPKENGLNHVGEIASMALDLVSVCRSFVIPHKPDVNLKIRAGIHSGPVVAGVVGTKMPRYCLFGDTVNTASRMESTSEALKIQCSSSSSELLKEIGGYILTCRGPLLVKGKGEMITWWLDGKECDGSDRRTASVTPAPRPHSPEIASNACNLAPHQGEKLLAKLRLSVALAGEFSSAVATCPRSYK
ncbi:atrial natriuretic peptide receptor 2-like [Pristis pectinata]|uniref:atrial natriuretic peptide receptor 2-like n=1 Tax=Pristis pectinata TaxID=685728 RepID=UPI00223DBF1C|nr:atrial natriuretic peptide receptor 2-like [Pristis pectinata]